MDQDVSEKSVCLLDAALLACTLFLACYFNPLMPGGNKKITHT